MMILMGRTPWVRWFEGLVRDPFTALGCLILLTSACAVTLVGGVAPLILLTVGSAAVLTTALRSAVSPEDRLWLLRMTLVTLGTRFALAAALHVFLIRNNPGGWMFEDDAGYVLLGQALARVWSGTASAGDIGLLGDLSYSPGYVRVAASVFWLGGNVLTLKILNVVIAALQPLLIYRTMRIAGLRGAVAGAVIVAVFPSLVLWSVLTLKDPVVVTALLIMTWSVTEFHVRRRWWLIPISLGALVVLRDLRPPLFAVFAILWPLSTLFALRDIRRSAVVAAAAILILAVSPTALGLLRPEALDFAAYIRGRMAVGARSAIIEPQPIAEAVPGQAFRIAVVGASDDPNAIPRNLSVPLGSQLVVEGAPVPPLPFGAASRPIVVVSSGDTIVMTAPGEQPKRTEPNADVATLTVRADSINVVAHKSEVGPRDFSAAVMDTLRYLPTGILVVVATPLPFSGRTAVETGLIPEMLLWYALLMGVPLGILAAIHRRALALVFVVSALFAVLLLLALGEGNLGTLVRHRSMAIPLATILGATGLAEALRWLRSRASGTGTQPSIGAYGP